MSEIKERLLRFDWYYSYSDDHSVWKFWNDEWKQIIELSKVSEENKKIFNVALEVVNNQSGYPSNDLIVEAWNDSGL